MARLLPSAVALVALLAPGAARASYIDVTPDNLGFGGVAVGGMALQTLTVTNVKANVQDRAMDIQGVTVQGADFAPGPNTCPASLAVGASCRVGVMFKPTAATSRTGTCYVRTSGGTFGVTLTGIGETAISVSPTYLDYGPVKVGESESATVQVTNLTSADYFQVTTTGGALVAMGNASTVLRPKESTTITLTFAPKEEGTFEDQVTVAWTSTTGSGAAGSTSVTVHGSGWVQKTSDSSDAGFCFVATAAYGTALAPEVQALRRFRDDVLLSGAVPGGRAFVGWYYRASPPAAQVIARSEPLRAVTRAALTPLVLTVAHPLGAAGLLASGALLWAWRRRRRDLRRGQQGVTDT